MWIPWLALVSLLLPTEALAARVLAGRQHVAFTATGSPGFLSLEGTTSSVALVSTADTLTFTVPLDTLDTGIGLRDRHLRETYAQTHLFPDAVLELPVAAITWPTGGEVEGTVEGRFTVHGVTVPTTVTWTLTEKGGTTRVRASFPFDVAAHGIEIPTWLGVTLDPAMRAEVRLELTDG